MAMPTDYFVLNFYTQICMCGKRYTHSALFVRTEKGLRSACTKPAYAPETVVLPTEHVAVCEACYHELKERPQREGWNARAAWRDPAPRPGNLAPKSKAQPKTQFTLDMLDALGNK